MKLKLILQGKKKLENHLELRYLERSKTRKSTKLLLQVVSNTEGYKIQTLAKEK